MPQRSAAWWPPRSRALIDDLSVISGLRPVHSDFSSARASCPRRSVPSKGLGRRCFRPTLPWQPCCLVQRREEDRHVEELATASGSSSPPPSSGCTGSAACGVVVRTGTGGKRTSPASRTRRAPRTPHHVVGVTSRPGVRRLALHPPAGRPPGGAAARSGRGRRGGGRRARGGRARLLGPVRMEPCPVAPRRG